MKKAIAAVFLLVAVAVSGSGCNTAKTVESFHDQFEKLGSEELQVDTDFFNDEEKLLTEQIDYHEFANRVSKGTQSIRDISDRLDKLEVPEDQKSGIFVYKKALTAMLDSRDKIVEFAEKKDKAVVRKLCDNYEQLSQIASERGADIVKTSRK